MSKERKTTDEKLETQEKTVAATKDKITLSQVLEVVRPEKRGGKHKCPLCHEWHLEVAEKGGKVVVHCWTENGEKHAKGQIWKYIASKVNGHGGSARQTESAPEPGDIEPRTERQPDEEQVPEVSLTLDEYAQMKMLPVEWLQKHFSVSQIRCNGRPAVALPYFGKDIFELAGVKLRLGSDGHKTHWLWLPGTSRKRIAAPYAPRGFADFGFIVASPDTLEIAEGITEVIAKEPRPQPSPKTLVICEGESDTQTLWYHGIAALGISGVNNWKAEFAQLAPVKEAERILIVKEPPKEGAQVDAGKAFVARICSDLQPMIEKVRIVEMRPEAKDPSALFLAEPFGFRTAWEKAVGNGRTVRKTDFPEPPDTFDNNDSGNADRLVAWYGEDFRFVNEINRFYVWNGSLWHLSTNGVELLPETKLVAKRIKDPKWRDTSLSAGSRHAMINMAKGEAEIWTHSDAFDRDPMLLTVLNGTLDLNTQTLRESRREDYISAQAPVTYNAEATCPKFDAFMDFIFGGDKETIHWMDKTLGYTITGGTQKQVCFLLLGGGNNGKSQLTGLMEHMLGDELTYSAAAKMFMLTEGGYDPADYELANYVAKRMVCVREGSRAGRLLNEELIKEMTGGTKQGVRQIRGEPFNYKPTHKLWLEMNRDPRIVGTDEGIWRRVIKIPFTQTVPKERRVEDYASVLFREEASGILNRLLRGVHDFLAEGLELVGAIAKATAAYRSSQNAIQRFLDTECVTSDPNMHVKCGTLYERYTKWAGRDGEFVMSNYDFSQDMQVQFRKDRVHGDGEHWFGIGLKAKSV